jgi:hypothetical protein
MFMADGCKFHFHLIFVQCRMWAHGQIPQARSRNLSKTPGNLRLLWFRTRGQCHMLLIY